MSVVSQLVDEDCIWKERGSPGACVDACSSACRSGICIYRKLIVIVLAACANRKKARLDPSQRVPAFRHDQRRPRSVQCTLLVFCSFRTCDSPFCRRACISPTLWQEARSGPATLHLRALNSKVRVFPLYHDQNASDRLDIH